MSKQIKILNLTLLYIVFLLNLSAQNNHYVISGKVYDKSNGRPLSFANVSVESTLLGTPANEYGKFKLRLEKGNYNIIFSYIGYTPDTVAVQLWSDKNVNAELTRKELSLGAVVVLPRENPAEKLVELTVTKAETQRKTLPDYKFNSYTKGIIKTTGDIKTVGRTIEAEISSGDTLQKKITGLIENHSIVYVEPPEGYRETILARNQTSNISAQLNTFTGGRLIQNFYSEELNFFGREVVNPISKEGLDYYLFEITDTLSNNENPVVEIYMRTLNSDNPGLEGYLYIDPQTGHLAKLSVWLNDSFAPSGSKVDAKVFQQYKQIGSNYVLPIDYRLFVSTKVLGLYSFGYELQSLMYNYELEPTDDEKYSRSAIVSVKPDADFQDESYWNSIQIIPKTIEEKNAERRIDSLKNLEKSFWNKFSFLSSSLTLNKNFTSTGLLGIYGFNKVEGHNLKFSLNYKNDPYKRLYLNTSAKYGFSDKRFKYNLQAKYLFNDYRTGTVKLLYKNTLTNLADDFYSRNYSTITALFGKYDFKNYYYREEFKFYFKTEITDHLNISFAAFRKNDESARTNSGFSFLNTDKNFSENLSITEFTHSGSEISLNIDTRPFIEDGYNKVLISRTPFYADIKLEFIKAIKDFLGGDVDYSIYKLDFYSKTTLSDQISLGVNIGGSYSEDALPLQELSVLDGTADILSGDHRFRTVKFGKVFSDKHLTISTDLSVGNILFEDISFLKDIGLTTTFFASYMTGKLDNNYVSVKNINEPGSIWEAGFGIGHSIVPVKFEFAWNPDYRGMYIGLNAPIIML